MKSRGILPVIALISALTADPVMARPPVRDVPLPDAVADIVLVRPFGLAATVVGSALFLATSPLSAIASIAPPHDGFRLAAEALVVAPAGFTFGRPVGEFDYEPIPVDF